MGNSLYIELMGTQCRCGDTKKSRETFCKRCYYSLPVNMRRALYNLMGHGYEESYAAAEKHLDADGRARA